MLLWNDDWDVSLQSYLASHIDVLVQIPKGDSSFTFFFTGFYGNPVAALHKDSWNLLQRIGQDRNIAWLVAGDFIELLYQFERIGKSHRNAS